MEEHVKLLQSVFDFAAIQALLQRPDFSFVYDSMHGVQGPYAHRVFCEVIPELGWSGGLGACVCVGGMGEARQARRRRL